MLTDLGHHVEELPQAHRSTMPQLAREFLLDLVRLHRRGRLAEAKRLLPAPGTTMFERDTLDHGGARPGHQQRGLRRRGTAPPRAHPQAEYLFRVLRPAAHAHPGDAAAQDRASSICPPAATRRRPAAAGPAPQGSMRYTKIVDDMVDKNLGWVPYTQLANLTGRPAISSAHALDGGTASRSASSSSRRWPVSRCSSGWPHSSKRRCRGRIGWHPAR